MKQQAIPNPSKIKPTIVTHKVLQNLIFYLFYLGLVKLDGFTKELRIKRHEWRRSNEKKSKKNEHVSRQSDKNWFFDFVANITPKGGCYRVHSPDYDKHESSLYCSQSKLNVVI